jgi:hypothetical protein
VPSPFQIANTVLSRLHDPSNSHLVHPSFTVDIPPHRLQDCLLLSQKVPKLSKSLPMLKGVKTVVEGTGKDDGFQEIINNYW